MITNEARSVKMVYPASPSRVIVFIVKNAITNFYKIKNEKTERERERERKREKEREREKLRDKREQESIAIT